MKKLRPFLLIILSVMLSFCACNEKTSTGAPVSSTTVTDATVNSEEAVSEETTGEEANSSAGTTYDITDNYIIDYEFDTKTSTNYSVIRVFKQKTDGSYQYPFVYAPNGGDAATLSPIDMMADKDFVLVVNAGIFDTTTLMPDGILIQNSEVICNSETKTHPSCFALTIDADGNLSYAQPDADADALAENGVVSAVSGFMPIIVDYKAFSSTKWNKVSHYTRKAQRQIIGQFGNGDYAIITCEGQGFQNSQGWTIAQAQSICQKLGLKFAYNLDGGGSTATLLNKKQFNSVYEGNTGRIVPTYIVFNGTTSFTE